MSASVEALDSIRRDSRRIVFGGDIPILKSEHKEFAGLRASNTKFKSVEEVKEAKHQIAVALNKTLGIDMNLSSRIAVVRFGNGSSDNKTVILYVDDESANEEEVNGVLSECRKKGLVLNENGTQVFLAAPSVVTSIAHGHLDAGRVQVTSESSESSLYGMFALNVAWASANGADDIDWIVTKNESYSQIAFKIEGRWHRPEQFKTPTATLISILGAAWQRTNGGKAATFDVNTALQGNIEVVLPPINEAPEGGRVRLRWSSLPNEKGTVVTTRIQRLGETARIRTLSGAGYLDWQIEAMRRATKSKGGIVTFAGRVGSGKTTTLAILLSELSRSQKIQTAEDPVEIDIPGAFQRTIARDLAQSDADDEIAFSTTVMGVLRSALDIFYQSEIRDVKTGKLARQVLESGHGVYTTTHARSGLGIVQRFTSPEIGIPRQVLGLPDGLKTNIYQAMISKTCPHCGKSPRDYANAKGLTGAGLESHLRYFGLLERLYGIDSENYRLRDDHGCTHCRKSQLPSLNGFNGRTPVCEIIEFNHEMLQLVYSGDDYGLINEWRSLSNEKYDSDDFSGKTAMEVAIYKASLGQIDPREIEPEFCSFEMIDYQRKNAKRN